MATVPEPMHQTVAAIYRLHEERAGDEPARTYLGGSIVGGRCERALWYGFRWAARARFDGRMLRLFDTGHREEARLLDELRAIGVTVSDRQPDGRQWRVEALGGHFCGHLDAVVLGLPEAPRTWHLVDVKTINAAGFKELEKKGFREAHPKYWAQAQVYMGLAGLARAVYFFVCKDSDRIRMERIDFDREGFEALIQRAERIVFAAEPPARLSEDAAWWECKLCDYHAVCHGTAAPAPTCRSCAHATPEREGAARWSCARTHQDLQVEVQRRGCDEHRFIPVLLERFARPVDADAAGVHYENTLTGASFVNGTPPAGFASSEIHAAADKRVLGNADPFVAELRRDFGGRLVA